MPRAVLKHQSKSSNKSPSGPLVLTRHSGRLPRLFYGQNSSPLLRQFRPGLGVRVVHGEIADDNGHGKGDREYTCERAQCTHEHADVGLGRHITISYRCHGDQRPPKPERDAVEVVVGIRLDAFRVVHEAREYHNTEHQEEDEERQLLRGCPKRLHKDLEAGRVAGQLEKAHDADNGEELEDVRVLQVRRELLQAQVNIKAKRRYIIYDVNG